MFSYRHIYHAGNHADVLKHIILAAILDYLTQKDAPLAAIDTHAGLGWYPLSSHQAQTSGEATQGILRLRKWAAAGQNKMSLAPAIAHYLALLEQFEAGVYPGSPLIMHAQLRMNKGSVQDKLHLFELNPRDERILSKNLTELDLYHGISVKNADGFEALKSLLPPPVRRALVLIDPSYELKTDYAQVTLAMQDALTRFATGVYAIWYPIIGRAEAHDLPKKLKKLAAAAGKSWLHASLNVGSSDDQQAPRINIERTASHRQTGLHVARAVNDKPGLRESGMFIINPPFTLQAQLQTALPQLKSALGQGASAAYALETSPQ